MQAPISDSQRCEEVAPQLEKLACYLGAAKRLQVELDHMLAQNLRTAAILDKEWKIAVRSGHITGSSLVEQVKASQRAWISYARSQCALEGGSSFGGSGSDILEAACHYRQNVARLSELKAAARLLGR
jgi:uncharacterized protein YecT (DUF1311 family)